MAIKKRNTQVNDVDPLEADKLANELADKPYGNEAKLNLEPQKESVVRTTISLPATLLESLEDLAIANKRSGKELRTVSALVRDAIQKYMNS